MPDHLDQQYPVPKADSWKMFNRISDRYDLLNRLLSLGMDLSWRKRLARCLPDKTDLKLLDLATGTGDVLIILAQCTPRLKEGVGLDMAVKMLDVGRKKIIKKGLDDRLALRTADAHQIPFPGESFDCTTIAFGIRNMDDPLVALKEMVRVLRPGGRSLILEFSFPRNRLLKAGHLIYLRTVVPALGWLLSGEYKAYKYLNATIEEFPYGDAFCQLMKEAGFMAVKAHPLLFGVATIYQGDKA
ncbi:MAG: bifunctional demethylmenaquinone methyltransferase/2-methoxy-6-polyprenyl-1,4-benzoquinol methylase UbiE [Candidatus Omnitrophica bacterium]|nr:bifunctional demethylmenaquinone methyltransferase/2-methoxy-6-polyprenyl-1,4-benzoquinol methylase UbiE [Candidatus Omnitrophota bacterium]